MKNLKPVKLSQKMHELLVVQDTVFELDKLVEIIYILVNQSVNIDFIVKQAVNPQITILNQGIKAVSVNFHLNHQCDIKLNLVCLMTAGKMNFDCQLNAHGAKLDLNSITLVTNNQQINTYTIEHNAKNTFGNMHNIGISLNQAELQMIGYNKIHQDMSGSESFQRLTGIVLDDSAITVDPILIIDNFDVKAGHGATAGKLNPEELFYLESRGLAKNEAQELIIIGKIAKSIELMPAKHQTIVLDEIIKRLRHEL